MQTIEYLPDRQQETLKGWVKTVLLIGLSVYFVYSIATGTITNYINASLTWLIYLTAALFLILGIANGLELVRNHRKTYEYEYPSVHNSTPISWKSLAVIAIPLILGILVPSRPLGAAAIAGNISLNALPATSTQFFTATDPLQWNVLDWLRAFNNSDDISSFNGKQANIVGFVYREPTFPDNQFMLTRFVISHCTADASAIGLPVVWDNTNDFPLDTWVEVRGSFQAGEFRGDTAQVLHATSVETVEQPARPYLYP